MAQELHHIVVVGGGAGGLELVTRLGNSLGKQAKAKITLVDQNLTHIWKPLLHETTSLYQAVYVMYYPRKNRFSFAPLQAKTLKH